MRKYFILIIYLIALHKLYGQNKNINSPFAQYLNQGHYQVGLKVWTIYDHSRSFISTSSYTNNNISLEDNFRPIRIYCWYPAKAGSTNKILYISDYIRFMLADWGKENQKIINRDNYTYLELFSNLKDVQIDSILNQQCFASLEPQKIEQQFPLIIVANGLGYESPFNQLLLCEYLARNGYVVISSPLTGSYSKIALYNAEDFATQIRDLEFLLATGTNFTNVSKERIGIFGFDLGGMSALELQMRNSNIDAIACFDAGNIFEHNLKLHRKMPSFSPERLNVPYLHATATKELYEKYGITDDLSVLEAVSPAPKYFFRFENMRHPDFTSLNLIGISNKDSSFWGPVTGEPKKIYAVLANILVEFYNTFLKNDENSYQKLNKIASVNQYKGVSYITQKWEGENVGLHISEFEQMCFTQGVSEAINIFKRKMSSKKNTYTLNETVLNRLAYNFLNKWGKPFEALKLFEWICVLYPRSSNAFDSLGEIYLKLGMQEKSLENYKKSLKLDSTNVHARSMINN